MNKSKVIIGIIIGISLLIFILIYVNPTLLLSIQLKNNDYSTIVGYFVDQSETMTMISILTTGQIPENIKEIKFNENAVGFGYAWFWEEIGDGHMGPGHAKGYIANIHKGDPLGDRWHVESVNVEILKLDEYGFNFCLSDITSIGSATINEDEITVNVPFGTYDVMNSDLVQVSSFNLIQNNICHSGFGGHIIHNIAEEIP